MMAIAEWTKQSLSLTKNLVCALPYAGKGRWCSVCGRNSRKFLTFGSPPREDALCAYCKSLERHRFTWLYFRDMTNLFDGTPKKVLHVAPEPCFESRLRKRLGDGYLTADLLDPRAMVRMDITNIQYPDGYFDVIYCSHVLEHVPDDRKAMREFYRVLNPQGWAVLLVPITVDRTFEDPYNPDPAERLRLFGQEDHVRRYGPDYADRLREAGFKVTVCRMRDRFQANEAVHMGFNNASGEIYHCFKA